jgi:hypothetical protein
MRTRGGREEGRIDDIEEDEGVEEGEEARGYNIQLQVEPAN